MGIEGSTVLPPLWHGLPSLDKSSVSGSASCALPPRYEAVKCARDFTGKTLGHWGLQARFDDIALVVSELVTNALRHGLARQSAPPAEPPVRLHLLRWSAKLVCAVRDPSREPPKAPPAAPDGPEHAAYEGLMEYTESLAYDERGELVEQRARGRFGEPDAFAESVAAPTEDAAKPAEEPEYAGCVDFTAESGRGLYLVASFSDSWGWHPLGGALPGKVVWALFECEEL